MPYFYQLFYENEQTGMPPMRPLWFQFPQDAKTLALDTEYLVGPDILVAPVLDKDVKSLNVYLPTDARDLTFWLNVFTERVFTGGKEYAFDVDINTIPIFQRCGSIVPLR